MTGTTTPARAGRRSTSVTRPALGVLLLIAGLALVAVLAAVDTTQGTANVGAPDVWKALIGRADGADTSVVVASRFPRAVAGLVVGFALGVAGAALQAVTRNVLAAPDTLAVNAGAYLALGIVSVTGLGLPVIAQSGVAFLGGLAAAALVLALSGLGSGTLRLVLAGTALALGLGSITQALVLLFPQQTQGLYSWNQGGIAQNGYDTVLPMLPVVGVAVVGFLLLSHRVDALTLGDDAARGLGVPVRSTRIVSVVLAVLLSAAAVTIAGPIGFVGLCAPALVRPIARTFPTLHRSWALLTVSGLVGAGIVVSSDVLLRAVVSGDRAVTVPTGVVTSVVGAVFLVVMALRMRDTGQTTPLEVKRIPGRMAVAGTVVALVAVLVGVVIASVLLGDAKLLLGDVTNWLAGRANQAIAFILDTRVPRVTAALLAGAALANISTGRAPREPIRGCPFGH